MALRSVAERLTHRVVVARRLPEPFGVKFFVSSEAGLRYLKPSLDNVDPHLLGLAEEVVKPGAVVWDIGANVGLFTFSSAHQAGHLGRVVAVEPDTYNVGLLRRSAAVQPSDSAPIDVIPAAVSDKPGVASFQIAVRNRSTNSLLGYGSTQMGGIRHTQTVPTLSLDVLAEHFPLPQVLKIDIEGAEVLALQGARKVLAARPTIICEVFEDNTADVVEALEPHGYIFYDGEAPPPRIPVEVPPYSLLAVAG